MRRPGGRHGGHGQGTENGWATRWRDSAPISRKRKSTSFFADPQGPAAAACSGAQRRASSTTDRSADQDRQSGPSEPWQPAFAATLARETHDSDLPPGQQSKIQVGFGYSDGFGREIQKKIQAEPGPRRSNGGSRSSSPRWVGSGWTIFNNKGKPVRQYEPFFDDTHDFEFGAPGRRQPDRCSTTRSSASSPRCTPNHTWEKVVFDPWRQETWDVNDTVLIADPRDDADVGDFFRRLPDTDYLPTWYAQRARRARTRRARRSREDRGSREHAGGHFLDSLGRTFLTIAHNRFARGDAAADR